MLLYWTITDLLFSIVLGL